MTPGQKFFAAALQSGMAKRPHFVPKLEFGDERGRRK